MDVLRPGSVLANDFLLVRSLAYGGLGMVYLAEQLSTGTLCAVKAMLPEGPRTPEMVRRFLREPRVLMRIPSDHVAHVIRTGVAEESPWFAMELFEGETLDTRLEREHSLEPGEAFSVLAQVCRALDAAHRRGIVHCNLKSGAVYLSRSVWGESVSKVIGFGIAEWSQDPDDSGLVAGTPLWMAPEQIQDRAAISPATDVWALGLLAFEMLVGEHYWNTPGWQESFPPTIFQDILRAELVSASARAEQLGVNGPLPAGFDDWFAQCVTRNPSDRFKSAGAALKALTYVTEKNPEPPTWAVSFPTSPPQLDSVLGYLRAVSGDPELELWRIVPGSVVLLLKGSREAYNIIRALFEQDRLPKVFGVAVGDVQWRGEPLVAPHDPSGQPEDTGAGARVFVSYSPVDDDLCDEMLTHFSMMRRQGLIREWHDRRIISGTNRQEDFLEAIDGSDLFLPLVSADYLASDYCFDIETRRALQRRERGEASVIPVIVRPCDWKHPPLGLLRPLPTEGKPVTIWPNRDEAWLDVTRGIREAVESPPTKRT